MNADGEEDKDSLSELSELDAGEESDDDRNVKSKNPTTSSNDEDDDEDEPWEEVVVNEGPQHQLPWSGATTFEVKIPNSFAQQAANEKAIRTVQQEDSRRKKWETQRRKWTNQFYKSLHATHLLCLIGAGMERNRWSNDQELQNLIVGLIPSNIVKAFLTNSICLGSNKGKGKASDSSAQLVAHLRLLLPFFKSRFLTDSTLDASNSNDVGALKAIVYSMLDAPEKEHDRQRILSPESKCILFVAALRGLGLRTRLIASLHPIPFSKTLSTGKSRRKPSSKYSRSSSKEKLTIVKKLKAEVTRKRKKAHASESKLEEKDLISSSPKKKAKYSASRTRKGKSKETCIDTSHSSTIIKPPNESSSSQCKVKEACSSTGISADDDSEDEAVKLEIATSTKSTSKDPQKRESEVDIGMKLRRNNLTESASDSDFMTGRLGSSSSLPSKLIKSVKEGQADSDTLPASFCPIQYMAEVFNPHDDEWLSLNPLTLKLNEPAEWELLLNGDQNRQSQIHYVVAYDEAVGIKDVTRRYTTQFMGRTSKLRLTDSGKDYLDEALKAFARDWDQNAVVESARLKESAIKEPMPTTIAGFNNHPLYVLEKHLKSNEVIYPLNKKHIVGTFRNMPVYPRKNVFKCKSREQWKREGRNVKEGQEPLKLVKARAVTIKKKREIEAFKEAQSQTALLGADSDSIGIDATQTPLYAEYQTEWFTYPAIQNGIIPKNDFGNIEIFHPRMMPQGAVLLQRAGMKKVAKKLGIDFAEAVTGFEFKAGRSFPRLEGIVVAKESVNVLIEATDEYEREEQKKAIEKTIKQEQVEKGKKIRGKKIKERVEAEYGCGDNNVNRSEYAIAETTAIPFVPTEDTDMVDRALEANEDDDDEW